MPALLCARPHSRAVDFSNTRFVVSKACGLDVNGRHLELGDEIPKDELSPEALRLVYEPPLSRIETLEFALSKDDPDLHEACARRGTFAEPEALFEAAQEPVKPKIIYPALRELTREQLRELCRQNDLPDMGKAADLRVRLEAYYDEIKK